MTRGGTGLSTRRDLFGAGLLLGAMYVGPSARACEAFSSTLRVSHPWTRASRQGATFAAVAMGIDQILEDDWLIGVTTPVATRAELVGDGVGPALNLSLPQGQEIVLDESATHLRLVGLTQPLQIGRSYPLLLEFKIGGLVHTTLSVDQLPLRSSVAGA
jgi:periplasmic copper chaperone A